MREINVQASDRPEMFTGGGLRYTGKLRIRPLFLGLCRVEELVEYPDGNLRWKRLTMAATLQLYDLLRRAA